MSTITTTDHAACDPKVEDGLRQLLATPPDKRPCAAVPFLRQRGLDNRQACAALRLYHLHMARAW